MKAIVALCSKEDTGKARDIKARETTVGASRTDAGARDWYAKEYEETESSLDTGASIDADVDREDSCADWVLDLEDWLQVFYYQSFKVKYSKNHKNIHNRAICQLVINILI